MGCPPQLSDAELVTLAVAQALQYRSHVIDGCLTGTGLDLYD
ncbi:hypothetical protein AB0P17_17330 [Streptomyces sp. NPDC088124]